MRTLAAALLLLTLLAAPARGEDPAPTLSVPHGIPVQLDGWPSPSEWADGARLDMGAGATLRVKQVRGTLLLGFHAGRAWPQGARLLVNLAPGNAMKGVESIGALRIDYEPREHDRPHIIAHQVTQMAPERVVDRIVGRFVAREDQAHAELAIPGDLLPAAPLRMVVQWAVPGNAGLGLWPNAVVVRGGGIPPGLRTSAQWARLTDLDSEGQGAYPTSEWKTWIDADKELGRRADEMHSYVQLLIEEWRNQPKDDALAEAEFFSNLRWIQARESLTPKDLMAKAKVLHWSNRRSKALGVYETLRATSLELAKTGASSHAQLLESMQRFADAEHVWRSIAKRPGVPGFAVKRYEAMADRAARYGEQWALERAARQKSEQAADQPLVALTTAHGTSVLVLHRNHVPKAVEHFLSFVEDGSYAGTYFHRVIGDALAEGGALASKVHGCEFSSDDRLQVPVRAIPMGPPSPHTFFRGAVALLWHPDQTLKSDFFVVTGTHPDWAKERHVIIGHVLSGMQAIDRVSRCDKIESMRVLQR